MWTGDCAFQAPLSATGTIPTPKLPRTLSRQEVLSEVFPEPLVLQISLGSAPVWGHEWKGNSRLNCLWRVGRKALWGPPPTPHPSTPLPTCHLAASPCARGQEGRSVAVQLSLCCHSASGTHGHAQACRACGGLHKHWWLMSHVCTQGAGKEPPTLKPPLTAKTSPPPAHISTGERISSWECLLDR